MDQICSTCKAEKPASHYYASRAECKACLREIALSQGMNPDSNITEGMYRHSKVCSGCRQDKPLADFHRDKRVKDGHTAECKECAIARMKAWQSTERGRTKLKAHKEDGRRAANSRRFYQRHKEKIAAYAKQPTVRKRAYESQKRWYAQNKHKRRAQDAVRYRVRTGQMIRPDTLPCSVCGKDATEYYHADYSKPLEVVAVCKPCHVSLHH